jgi:hypothetical protein
MRTSYLICYDICDDKRLRKVFQTMRGYGDHLQFSIGGGRNPAPPRGCQDDGAALG